MLYRLVYTVVKRSVSNKSNALKHGRHSKEVQAFLKKYGLNELELPSSGSFAQDMALSLAAYQEKKESAKLAINLLKSKDERALTAANQLFDIELLLAQYEQKAKELKDPSLLVENKSYREWQKLKFDILKHYERMKFDLKKIETEQRIKKMKKAASEDGEIGEDVLYVVE